MNGRSTYAELEEGAPTPRSLCRNDRSHLVVVVVVVVVVVIIIVVVVVAIVRRRRWRRGGSVVFTFRSSAGAPSP